MVEKRKHKRLDTPRDAVVFLRTSWPDFTIVGKIIDVSTGGLAFLYTAARMHEDEPRKLDIILADSRFSLREIPFKTVSDVEIPVECPVGFMTPRRRGVQFGHLTENQRLELAYFIQCCNIKDTEGYEVYPYSANKAPQP
jgi:hypothetical protein